MQTIEQTNWNVFVTKKKLSLQSILGVLIIKLILIAKTKMYMLIVAH